MVPKLTTQGYNLLVSALSGTGLKFTQIKIGNGDVPDDFASLTDIVNPIVSIGITTITKSNNYVVLKAPMSNKDLDTGVEMAEMGVFAENPEGGEDILYAYAHYKLSGDAAAVYIPPITSNLVEITHNVHVYIGELDNVTAILVESSEYATKKALEDHQDDHGNPHKVDKTAVGLGNVPNVTPENQQPIFSNIVTEVTTDSSGNKNLPNISNGDTMGVILQKVRSAIAAFVAHISSVNPHGMKAEDVGAAKESHYHSANDINSGTLGLARGGTGAKNAAEALANLGGISQTLIWENKSPDATFAVQMISGFNPSQYDGFEILYKVYGDKYQSSGFLPYVNGTSYTLIGISSSINAELVISSRSVNVRSDGMQIYNASFAKCSDQMFATSGDYCIPWRIYGIKGVKKLNS